MVDMNMLDKRVSDLTVRELVDILREVIRDELKQAKAQAISESVESTDSE